MGQTVAYERPTIPKYFKSVTITENEEKCNVLTFETAVELLPVIAEPNREVLPWKTAVSTSEDVLKRVDRYCYLLPSWRPT